MSETANPGPTAFLILSLVIVPVSLYLQTMFGMDLFSRSGSLIVLFALAAEYNLLRVRDKYHGDQLRKFSQGGSVDFLTFHPSKGHRYQEAIAHLSVFAGTIIWGYGSLITL